MRITIPLIAAATVLMAAEDLGSLLLQARIARDAGVYEGAPLGL